MEMAQYGVTSNTTIPRVILLLLGVRMYKTKRKRAVFAF